VNTSKYSHNLQAVTSLHFNRQGNIMTKPFTIFMLVKTTARWLALAPPAA